MISFFSVSGPQLVLKEWKQPLLTFGLQCWGISGALPTPGVYYWPLDLQGLLVK